jgi:starch synthase
MRILTICAEYAPLAKVGGLADVTAGLSAYLARRGHEVVVVMPRYGVMGERASDTAVLGPRVFQTADHEAVYSVARLHGEQRGPAIFLVDCREHFGGAVYEQGAREARRFMLLSRAALELAQAIGFSPDVVHCHDWHAAPALIFLDEVRRAVRLFRDTYAVLTIHNIGYQGVFDAEVLDGAATAAARGLFPADDIAIGQVNFLKAGIMHADALTTVSPTHAAEICSPEFGMGLDALLRQRRHRLAGILNGVDYSHWSPATDELIPMRYTAVEPEGKRTNRQALVAELGLDADDATPVVGMVTRLAWQKGIDLVVDALPGLLAGRRLACAFLGSGEPRYVNGLRELAREHPGRVRFVEDQDEALAHRIIAGSDLLLVPSRYEPCGLTQMYALRYGTVPVVRRTGGLADTVTHFDPETGAGTGSVFLDADVGGLTWGLRTALDWFDDPRAWQQLMRNGMAQDFSWEHQGREYEALFARLVA